MLWIGIGGASGHAEWVVGAAEVTGRWALAEQRRAGPSPVLHHTVGAAADADHRQRGPVGAHPLRERAGHLDADADGHLARDEHRRRQVVEEETEQRAVEARDRGGRRLAEAADEVGADQIGQLRDGWLGRDRPHRPAGPVGVGVDRDRAEQLAAAAARP